MGQSKIKIFIGVFFLAVTGVTLGFFVPAWAAQPGVANPIANQTVAEDTAFNFQFAQNTFVDTDDGDTLTYSAQLDGGGALPAWLSFNTLTRTFSGTPSNSDVGTLDIDVIADNGNGETITDTFEILIANVNDAPTAQNEILFQNATEDSTFNFQLDANTFEDIDAGDILTYTALSGNGSALPAWLSFDAATRTFSGTPLNVNVGTNLIKVIANDGHAGVATVSLYISVQNTHDDVTIANPIPDRITTANNTFYFRFASNTFEADYGSNLTYSAQLTGGGALPAWLSFNSSTQSFGGTPSSGDIGTTSIDVTADDGNGGTITESFTVEVVAASHYSGAGDGLHEASAFIVTSCNQLQEMINNLGAWYRLGNNIDCSDTVNWNNGDGFIPVGTPETPFLGILEGKGYTISSLTINRPNTDHVGLFGYAGAFLGISSIRNFILQDVSIHGQNDVGGVAGENRGSINEVGVTGEVNGVNMVGGAVGNNGGGILNMYSRATISGVPGSGVAGGLVGQNGGFISRSYSTGGVPVGVGKGGLVGDDLGSGGVGNAYWDTQSSGISVSDEGIGKTTAELKNVATFTSGFSNAWDFVGNPNDDSESEDIWDINPLTNQGYPYLYIKTPANSEDSETPENPSITEVPKMVSPVNSSTHDETTQGSHNTMKTEVSLAPTQDVAADSTIPENDTSNPIAQTNTFKSDNDKSDNSGINFMPWAVGFLLMILIIGYRIYRHVRRHG